MIIFEAGYEMKKICPFCEHELNFIEYKYQSCFNCFTNIDDGTLIEMSKDIYFDEDELPFSL